YGTEVGRDVLADQAVPARRADGEESLLVRKTHGGAVDLHFERIAGGATLRDEPGVAVFPFGEVRLVERVGERQHRHEVAVLLTVRRLAVTSSPTRPFPRVAPTARSPFSYVRLTAAPSIFTSSA